MFEVKTASGSGSVHVVRSCALLAVQAQKRQVQKTGCARTVCGKASDSSALHRYTDFAGGAYIACYVA
jgi:hypothetical protein